MRKDLPQLPDSFADYRRIREWIVDGVHCRPRQLFNDSCITDEPAQCEDEHDNLQLEHPVSVFVSASVSVCFNDRYQLVTYSIFGRRSRLYSLSLSLVN